MGSRLFWKLLSARTFFPVKWHCTLLDNSFAEIFSTFHKNCFNIFIFRLRNFTKKRPLHIWILNRRWACKKKKKMAFAAARMIKDKAKRPSTDFALYPVSPILRQNITENWPCHEVEPKKGHCRASSAFSHSPNLKLVENEELSHFGSKTQFDGKFVLNGLLCLKNFIVCKISTLPKRFHSEWWIVLQIWWCQNCNFATKLLKWWKSHFFRQMK